MQARLGSYYVEPEGGQAMQQQLRSYWSDPQAQGPLAQQPVAPWAAPASGSQQADIGVASSWSGGSQWADAGPSGWPVSRQEEAWYPTQPGLAYFDTQAQEETDSSATSSDSGTEQLLEQAVSGMSSSDAAQQIYMLMRAAKRTLL